MLLPYVSAFSGLVGLRSDRIDALFTGHQNMIRGGHVTFFEDRDERHDD
jgi:hypothetical protein